MTFLRVVLSIFAILNVVFWALLAWVWAVKPSWAARIPLNLGSDERFKTAVPVWARLAAAVAAFWAVAAVLYLTVYAANRLRLSRSFFLAPFSSFLGSAPPRPAIPVLQPPKN